MRVPPEFKPISGLPGWYRTPTADWHKLEARALRLHEDIALPHQVICGLRGTDDDGHAIYLIEDATAIEVVREFGTGSHNALLGVETGLVCEELSRVFDIAPFRPYFADAAGYKANFLNPLSLEQAQEIESIITLGTEGYESEWSGEGPIMADLLLRERGFRLWWD